MPFNTFGVISNATPFVLRGSEFCHTRLTVRYNIILNRWRFKIIACDSEAKNQVDLWDIKVLNILEVIPTQDDKPEDQSDYSSPLNK